MPLKLILPLIFLFSVTTLDAQPDLYLIPEPQEIKHNKGALVFSSIQVNCTKKFEKELRFFNHYHKQPEAEVHNSKPLVLTIIKNEVKNPHGFDGAYKLTIDKGIVLVSPTSTGVFYGIQTLNQLIKKDADKLIIPKCEINDWPAFKVRGFMHDVGRNFISLERLKQQLDIMAFYKYNVFHMHLTDNPGWRLESKLYPQLQSAEATLRKPGKFYSQKEFIELVQFCKERHITIIPELDVPGHSLAFRKAFGLESMNSPQVQKILIDLIEELCSLVPAEDMPYIHLGTDEVRQKAEKVNDGFLLPLIKTIEQNNRTYVSWWHGIKTPGDTKSVKQLWAQTDPLEGHAYFDSRSNYINHLDPLCAISRLFFQQPCRSPNGDDQRLGGILCCWPDNRVDDENNTFRQNPIYPSLVAYSQAIWHGVKNSTGQAYWAQLPDIKTPEYDRYVDFEQKVSFHRDEYFNELEFPFLENAHIPWKIIGPFDHGGDMSKSFGVENEIRSEYLVEDKTFKWQETILRGGTIHLRHFFGFPSPISDKEGTVYALNYVYSPIDQELGFWIGFHGWSRSGGRRGGPFPAEGQWHTTNPKIWVNNKEIPPPNWKQPGLAAKTLEIPFIDEDYFYREPSLVKLNKGWNKFLLKVPHGGTSWKWMFTCVPVEINGNNVREVEGLKYSTDITN